MSAARGDGHFPETQWTLIRRIKSDDADIARRALEELCTQYHYPLYCYIRRRGLEHHDAQDALHDFLAKLLRNESFGEADVQKGRLRAFLCTALQRHLANWADSRTRRERVVFTADLSAEDEARYQRERFRDDESPDRIFARKWAQALLGRVLAQLGAAYETEGKGELFRALRPIVMQGGSLRGQDPAAIAAKLGMNEPALRKALSRLLREYGELLKSEVVQTVADESEIEAELAELHAVFGR